jgi:hypothetical protein
MSASDAAPLPRLGEVFFDVRGHSRSMRLSWYADTDVAVFSIWQGGKCTGTFRLPMEDLSRMIEVLQRGPERRNGPVAGERKSADRGNADRHVPDSGREHRKRGYAESGLDDGYQAGHSGGLDADNTMVHNPDARNSAVSGGDFGADAYAPGSAGGPDKYRAGEYAAGRHDAGQYGTGDFSSRDFNSPDYRPAEYRSDDYSAGEYGRGDYRSASYDPGGYRQGDYGTGDYAAAEQGPGGYPDAGYRDSGSRTARPERNEPADYSRPDPGQDPRAPRPEYWQGDDRYQSDEAGYGQQRFEPPYVRPRPDSSEPDFMDDAEYRLPADPAGRPRHSTGRHSGRQGQ